MRQDDFAPLPRLLTFSVDVEGHPGAPTGTPRHLAATRRLLDFLDRHAGHGTFFVLGEVARQAPGLVREIHERGHEVASHSHAHTPLEREDRAAFAGRLGDARRHLEDLTGAPVSGFRAPLFSLTRRSLWAVDAVWQAGFLYSSSVLPARSPAYGLPGAPREPFLWPNGLLEIPCPVARLGPLTLPFLGGMYLRYLPPWRLRQLARRASTAHIWTYCHPYDIDAEEPFPLGRGGNPLSSLFLWANRRTLLHRLDLLMTGRVSLSFAERRPLLAARAPRFTPEAA